MKWLWLALIPACALSTEVDVVDSVYLPPRGRVSSPSYGIAPPGSLWRANNCVLREPGVLAPRPDETDLDTISLVSPPVAIGPQFDNGSQPEQPVFLQRSGAFDLVTARDLGGAPITYSDTDGTTDSPVLFTDVNDFPVRPPIYERRDNLYYSDAIGVFKWQSTDDSDVEPVFDFPVWVTLSSLSGSGDTWLPIDSHVEYLPVAVFEDANGVIRRSAPGRAGYVSSSGEGTATRVSLWIRAKQTQVEAYGSLKSIELYRTRSYADTVTLPAEWALVAEYPLDDFTVGFGYYRNLVVDTVPDDSLGMSLYSSSSQPGGVGAANIAPPAHIHHATWRGFEFWGDVAEKEFFPQLRTDLTTINHVMTLGALTVLGDPDVTVSDLDGAEIGMLVSDPAGVRFPRGTYITAISGSGPYTVTMSENALSSSSSDLTVMDSVFVLWGDGSTDRIPMPYPGVLPAEYHFGNHLQVVDFLSSDTGAEYISSIAFTVSSTHRPARMGVSQLWASSPSRYQGIDVPDLATGSGDPSSGGLEVRRALFRNGLKWSKKDEPEVTTLTSFQPVGGSGPITGLAALRDALIICKSDGVYRLTGTTPERFRIDPIDTSVRILGGVQVLSNAAYALSDRGIVRITPNDVAYLDQNVCSDFWAEELPGGFGPRLAAIRRLFDDTGGFVSSMFAVADETQGEYVLFAQGLTTAASGNQASALVFNVRTGAFTTWGSPASGAVAYLAGAAAKGNYVSGSGPWQPTITLCGIRPSAEGFVSIADNDPDDLAEDQTQFTQDIAMRALIEGDPTILKVWREFAWDAESSSFAKTATFRRSESDPEFTLDIPEGETSEIRIWPPAEVARSAKVVPGLRGTGITVRGLRASFSGSGNGVPLDGGSP